MRKKYVFTKRAEVIKNNFQVCEKQSAFSFQHFLMDSVCMEMEIS